MKALRLSDLLALMIWAWCIHRNTICAKHISGVNNVEANQESRKQIRLAGWMLNRYFQELGPSERKLFAARHNHQLQRHYTYRPDPEAVVIDA